MLMLMLDTGRHIPAKLVCLLMFLKYVVISSGIPDDYKIFKAQRSMFIDNLHTGGNPAIS